jgi:hypothetical protein
MRRIAAAAIGVTVLLVASPGLGVAHSGPWHWPLQSAMRRIDGKRIHVGNRVVRIDSETTLCSGAGRAVRRHGVRAWKHFDCTYSVFVAGDGIYDCDFRVHVVGVRRFLVTNARWTAGAP